MITDSQAKALTIIQKHPGIKPWGFAKYMWPNSDGWSASHKAGHGSSRGHGMNLAAGGYLGKLAREGWIKRSFSSTSDNWYHITQTGKDVLLEYNNAKQS